MRLRPRQKRSATLRNPQVIVLLILFFVMINFLRLRRTSTSVSSSVSESQTKELEELSKFARTDEELAALRSFQLASLLAEVKSDEIRLGLVTKAKAGRVRNEVIRQLEPNDVKRALLAIVARQRLGDLTDSEKLDDDTEQGDSETLEMKEEEDVTTRILGSMPINVRATLSAQMSMDTENKWRPLPKWALDNLERDGANPLNRNCSVLYVPDHEGKYGGLTADCGWMIMSTTFAMEKGECAEFPQLWGHGCDDDSRPPGWTCFFKPIQEREYSAAGVPPAKPTEIIKLRSALSEHRKMVRRDPLFKADFKGHRYPLLNAQINDRSKRTGQSFHLDWNADLLAWRLAFRWTFRVNDKVRKLLDDIETKVLRGFRPEDIAGAHLRFGDKLGLRPGPREAYLVYQVKDFAERLALYYSERNLSFPKAVFVATDDYNASMQLGKILGPSVTILTSADPARDQGFSIVEYRNLGTNKTKFDAAVRLWADMEILSRTQMVLLSFQSNIGRTVTLMRFDKSANTTISVDPTGPRCSKENRVEQLRTHNFWLCP